MTEIMIRKAASNWQVWIGDTLRITCENREQAELVALKAALLSAGEIEMEDLQ